MLRPEVWAQAGGPAKWCGFYLCVGCIERRLDRPLTPGDFVTEGWRGTWHVFPSLWSPRLRSRVNGEALGATESP